MDDKKSIWDEFTNKYSVSKTLRFELKPIGKTLNYIDKRGLIKEDKIREKKFNEVKKIMDDYYKDFIEKALTDVKIDLKDLKDFQNYYKMLKRLNSMNFNSKRTSSLKKNENFAKIKKGFENLQKRLRESIKDKMSKVDGYKNLFGKNLVTKDMPKWLENNKKLNDLEIIKSFDKWTTYFTGFFENRKNVFSAEDKSTSLIFRIVHDNLPKYLDNLERFNGLKKLKDFDFKSVENNFKKELTGETLNDFFALKNFNNCLDQKGIDKFNLIVGGYTTNKGGKIKGLNEHINEFAQKFKKSNLGKLELKNEKKKIRKLILVPLFKQILSDKTSVSFIQKGFENNEELLSNVNEFCNLLDDKFYENLKNLFSRLHENDLNQIYVRKNSLTKISKELLGDWNGLEEGLREIALEEGMKKNGVEKFLNKEFFSINILEEAVQHVMKDHEEKKDIKTVCKYFSNFNFKNKDLINEIRVNFELLNKLKLKDKNLRSEKCEKDVEKIKDLLDSISHLFHFIQPFDLTNKVKSADLVLETDSNFYAKYEKIYEILSGISPLYDKVRNFVTKKPFSKKKFKLNFKNSTLLNGWSKSKETDNWSVLFKKNENFYLGIMTPDSHNLFKIPKEKLQKAKCEFYEKINYNQLSTPDRNFPRVFFSAKRIKQFNPSKEILRIRNHSLHTKGGEPQKGYKKLEFNLNDCHKMIDFFKESISKSDWNKFNFKFKKTKEYADISEFYKDVSDQGYKINFEKYSEEFIHNLVNEGKLYLFQIWNKDFSKFSKGRKNLHTLYWEELFSKENLKNVIYKLNGEAEIFFRKKSISAKITHPKNHKIENKDPFNNKKTSVFKYDLIKDKRYTENKFLFHCPITLNFKSKSNNWKINEEVNSAIAKKKNVNILSLDRGERNLLYYTLIDLKGNIIMQDSFNLIKDDKNRSRNYYQKLTNLEKLRDEARKNWKSINNIKELKEGYLSQVVHKLSKLAIENNAIIVLEDLNFGFKRGRFKVERQVYQKFERKLIEKLNYLVFKSIDKNKAGGILKAFQLTGKFESFKKLGKQSGILYYIPAAYTSKIDPKTGFVNMLWPKYKNINNSKEFFKKFDEIKYNLKEDFFEFSFKYSNFISELKENRLSKDNWTICTYSKRLVYEKIKNTNKHESKEVDLTSKFKKLFDLHNIEYASGKNLISSNSDNSIVLVNEVSFFKKLMYLLRLTLQLRNTNSVGEDYILSCVKDKFGNFFDSRKAKKFEPRDADSNGAYHIGIKGVMLVDSIKNTKKGKPNLKITKNDFINQVIKMRL